MLEVSKYIKDLLYIHDCVILPGFGGFVANYKPANIDDNLNVVFPPTKSIGFNRNLSQNDGLLINRLAEAENLSYSEAEKAVSFLAEDIRVRMQRGERVNLDKIGCFYNDRKHNLQFEPSKELNYLVDVFGMEQLNLPKLSQITDERKIPVVVPLLKSQSLFTKKRLWYAAAAIPFILAIALLPMNSQPSFMSNNASMGGMLDGKKEVTEKIVQLKPVISPPEELVLFEPKIKEEAKVNDTKDGMFYLISGSFTSIKNAEILKKELISKSYPAKIIKNKKLYSVAINQFNNRSEADQFKKKVISRNSKAFCWILKK